MTWKADGLTRGKFKYSLTDLGEWIPKGKAKVGSAKIYEIAERGRNDLSPQCGVTNCMLINEDPQPKYGVYKSALIDLDILIA